MPDQNTCCPREITTVLNEIMSPKHTDCITNNEDPDQTALPGALFSGSTLVSVHSDLGVHCLP